MKSAALGDMVVQEIMTSDPVSVPLGASLEQVEGLLLELDVRHLPVVEDGQLKGIISDRDVAPYRWSQEDSPAGLTAAQLMSSDLITVAPEVELGEAIDIIIDQRIGALPVVEGESRQMVGIISYVDLLRAARALVP